MKYFEWRGEKISQFVLGSVQLGMDYGISNKTGQPGPKVACSILDSASELGVNMIDTAQAYGDSEMVIGDWIKSQQVPSSINIISKWHPDLDLTNATQVCDSIEDSVAKLGTSIWGMMIHDEACLQQWDQTSSVVADLKTAGFFKYLGMSVYSIEAAKKAIMIPEIDFIQVPCNAWDHRMIESGVFKDAKENDTLCFVRSIFLQGLLLMDKDQVRAKLPGAYNASKKWDELVIEKQTKKEALAINFATGLDLPLVVGIDNEKQLFENFLNFDKKLGVLPDIVEMHKLVPYEIKNPSMWPKIGAC